MSAIQNDFESPELKDYLSRLISNYFQMENPGDFVAFVVEILRMDTEDLNEVLIKQLFESSKQGDDEVDQKALEAIQHFVSAVFSSLGKYLPGLKALHGRDGSSAPAAPAPAVPPTLSPALASTTDSYDADMFDDVDDSAAGSASSPPSSVVGSAPKANPYIGQPQPHSLMSRITVHPGSRLNTTLLGNNRGRRGRDGSPVGNRHDQRGPRGNQPGVGNRRQHNPRDVADSSTISVIKLSPNRCNVSSINRHFSRFGTIVGIQVNPNMGQALVTFADREEAMAALRSPASVLGDRFIQVHRSSLTFQSRSQDEDCIIADAAEIAAQATTRPAARTGSHPAAQENRRIIVTNIPPSLSSQEAITRHFERFGKTQRVSISLAAPVTAIVTFVDGPSAKEAVAKGFKSEAGEIMSLRWAPPKGAAPVSVSQFGAPSQHRSAIFAPSPALTSTVTMQDAPEENADAPGPAGSSDATPAADPSGASVMADF
ncbi:hypothetical protein H696_01628 [Fonticula alba]|uniref:RRM domain-containing protein n=1 Tax=Fonticula alba TaxID=691883 RepID=A0A058ZE78_FONAL|nr:hypothetical protein H696_01628 [Fonticula alba]KCV72228.1 hypothetical protein H696_01628 [Fonticula alba]|eukprot:XP_009493806.1 hypothetical protein H696_01628 [Fonticula alba]